MGRKSIKRERKPLTPKAKEWVKLLMPLLQDKDLQKLTLDEMAALINKSKSTIYTYFSTKEEIYLAATQLVIEEIKFAISTKENDTLDMEKALLHLMMALGVGIEGISISYLEQLKKYFPTVWTYIDAFATEVLNKLAFIYQEGMNRGDFKKFNISLLTALDNHFVMNIMTNASAFSNQGLSLNDLIKEYLELRLSALRV